MNWKLMMNVSKLVMVSTAILILSAQIVLAQDFTVQMANEEGKIIATRYISQHAVRIVSTYPADSDIIYRMETGKIISINNKEKTYGEITAAELRQRMEQKESSLSPQQKELMQHFGMSSGATTLTKIGPGETIAGYATDKYSVKGPTMQGEIWVAPALEVPPGYYDMVTSMAVSQLGGTSTILKQLKEKQVKGYLLKMTGSASAMPMMKGVTFTQVAKSVEKHPIAASTFEPPAGYQKVARPQ